jgi:hypothetical protein
MFCVTPDGIKASQELHKGDPKDAKVLAHLEDIADALHEAKRDQMDDLMEDPDDENDAQVMAHLEDTCSSLHEALRDQYMDMMHEGDEGKSAGPVSRTLTSHYSGFRQNSAEIEEIDLRTVRPVRFPGKER